MSDEALKLQNEFIEFMKKPWVDELSDQGKGIAIASFEAGYKAKHAKTLKLAEAVGDLLKVCGALDKVGSKGLHTEGIRDLLSEPYAAISDQPMERKT